ncbi:MAG: hypothetical protein F2673_03045 [Actinobacteria bacterium]|nr:hypothetical protein [Actinomycetota bacterium]MSY12087.1 hypothetical protein [Actinomycetota bacterium]MSZ03545.1 hypothetical protein [Actinomycetota bacterium]
MKRRGVLGAAALAVSAGLTLAATAGGITASFATGSPVPGSQGTDTALPNTASRVTVSGRGRFSSLRISVNQTEKLANQAVSITWTGGEPTVQGPGRFAANFMQIFQCWGDDDAAIPDNPGPPPEQCVQGAVGGNYNGPPAGVYPNVLATSRVIFRSDWAGYDPTVGFTDSRTTNVWRPFRSVTGDVVNVHANPNFNPAIVGGNYWLNSYFNEITTNEIAGATTDAQGNGADLFQLNTGNQSTGLGCGQRVQPVEGGGKKVPQCWIVVVPRGTAAEENAGTPFGGARPEQFGVATSPLSPLVWANRIAIPLSFNPVDSPCDIRKQDRRIAGSEVALTAIGSWQPALCTGGGLPPFSYATIGDDAARGQLANPVEGSPGLVVVSRPLASGTYDTTKPIVYAPLTASGLVVGFNVERVPKVDAPQEEQELAGVRVATMKLTPRLIAKLLTQSYVRSVAINGEIPSFSWLADNALHLGTDPDFLQFNPEFALLQNSSPRNFSGMQLPSGPSDAAKQLWNYVLDDPEAKSWLSGVPDPWGMKVNPVYAADVVLNPSGVAFGEPVPNSFPKSDPYCYQAPSLGSVVPAPLCGTEWLPYTGGLMNGAQITRAAADGARVEFNIYAATPADAWKREGPQLAGYRSMLTLTDTPSAFQYGLQTAWLSRPGDNGESRRFIAPTNDALVAGVAAMAPGEEPTFLEPKLSTPAPDAYPLTTLTYAAISPLAISTAARADYAAFLKYAAEQGQQAGLALGDLPPGYVPLSETLKAQATEAAAKVLSMRAPPGGGGGGFFTTTIPETLDSTVPDTSIPTSSTAAAIGTSVPETSLALGGAERPLTPGTSLGSSRLTALVLLALLVGSGLAAALTSRETLIPAVRRRLPSRWVEQ